MEIAEHFHIVFISRKEEKAKIDAAVGIEGKCQELKSNDAQISSSTDYSVKQWKVKNDPNPGKIYR